MMLIPSEVFGGARRNRTADLLNAIQALSQLSYGPTWPRCLGTPRKVRRRSSGVSIVGSDERFKSLRRLPYRHRSDPTHRRRLPLRPRGRCRPSASSSTTSMSSSETGFLLGLLGLDLVKRDRARARSVSSSTSSSSLAARGHDRGRARGSERPPERRCRISGRPPGPCSGRRISRRSSCTGASSRVQVWPRVIAFG